MAIPELIYCAGKNKRCDEIALKAGFKLGARLPDTTIYYPPYFIDQDWQKAKAEPGYRDRYMAVLAQHRPHIATVLDWETGEQLPEVLDWAREAVQYVNVVVIIPKVMDGISYLPRRINGKEVRLGYSVKTKFAGTLVPVREFLGWPVHLLGGSPHKQMSLAEVGKDLAFATETERLNVVSVDGNMHLKMANRGHFWTPGIAYYAVNPYWPTLREFYGKRYGDGTSKAGAPYEAFRRSCANIMATWQQQPALLAA